MNFVQTDTYIPVSEATPPNYNANNPIWTVVAAVEANKMAAEREQYDIPAFQYLFHFTKLSLYGPTGQQAHVLDPAQQDNKEDFQKQNVSLVQLGNTFLIRGWVRAGDWVGPFLKVSYQAGPDTILSAQTGHQLGNRIKLWLKVGKRETPQLIDVPYRPDTDRYEVELWGYPGQDLRTKLDTRGQQAIDNGFIQNRPDLILGTSTDFQREDISDVTLANRVVEHLLHPILPLTVQLAWANGQQTVWDSQGGKNYQFMFSMLLRGWSNYLKAGVSGNPHGGVGFLEYRNLLSNYFEHSSRNELGRQLEPWNVNALGQKNGNRQESFFAVDYMDLHLLRPACGIGLHRHRDNQEVFMLMEGRGLMMVGDWCQFDERERAIEVRTMQAGDLVFCKTGQLHALLNVGDTDAKLFMFGGYD